MKQYKFYDLMDDLPIEVQMAVREARKPFGVEAAKHWGLCETSESYEIDITQIYPEPRFTVRLNGVGTLPRGDIQAVKAKSKNGKSHFCAILCASVLGCNDFGFTSNFPDASVLLCDTEQAAYNSVKIVRKIHALLGWPTHEPNDRLKALNLRSYAPKERMRKLPRRPRDCALRSLLLTEWLIFARTSTTLQRATQ